MTLAERLKRLSPTEIDKAELNFLSDLSRGELAEFQLALSELGEEARWHLVRRIADLAITRFDENYERALLALLQDPSARVRQAAVHGLQDEVSPSRARALVTALQSERDPTVRMALLEAMSEITLADVRGELPDGLVSSLCAELERVAQDPSESKPMRRAALLALSYYSDNPVARKLIDEFYVSPDLADRATAIACMGRTVDAEYLPAILEGLSSSEPSIRFEAAIAAGELEAEEAVEKLVPLIYDTHTEVALAAIDSLGSIGTRECIRVLQALAEGDDLDLAPAAEEALSYALWKLHGSI